MSGGVYRSGELVQRVESDEDLVPTMAKLLLRPRTLLWLVWGPLCGIRMICLAGLLAWVDPVTRGYLDRHPYGFMLVGALVASVLGAWHEASSDRASICASLVGCDPSFVGVDPR
ncbi:MAG: hypothetical protein Q8Q09_03275 [Deltaproteobacteria bacterium]|nr:hypothetical protein [Deltaproteobacteria bacterium]